MNKYRSLTTRDLWMLNSMAIHPDSSERFNPREVAKDTGRELMRRTPTSFEARVSGGLACIERLSEREGKSALMGLAGVDEPVARAIVAGA